MICPHGCSPEPFWYQDCPEDPGAVPGEGAVGMCARCFRWWQVRDGAVVKYEPTTEERALVETHFAASVKRYMIRKQSN